MKLVSNFLHAILPWLHGSISTDCRRALARQTLFTRTAEKSLFHSDLQLGQLLGAAQVALPRPCARQIAVSRLRYGMAERQKLRLINGHAAALQ